MPGQPGQEASEAVTDGGERGVGVVAMGGEEEVAAHAAIGLHVAMTSSTAERRRRSRWMASVRPRFRPQT